MYTDSERNKQFCLSIRFVVQWQEAGDKKSARACTEQSGIQQ